MASEFDALMPPDMARKAELAGVSKVNLPFTKLAGLSLLAGAFIALGAIFATTVTAGTDTTFGLSRVVGGLAFSLGLVLVIVGGAELFTGNNLIAMAWASGQVTTRGILRNWGVVFVGNLVGAMATAGLVVLTEHHALGGGVVGDNALAIAEGKITLGWMDAFVRGVLANALVCLAVWLTMSARTVTDRILAIVFPITAFVAAGFEHSIANMYFIPAAILLREREDAAYWDHAATTPGDHDSLTWSAFISDNLVPVTLGNIVGGTVLVALVYWFIYLADDRSPGTWP